MTPTANTGILHTNNKYRGQIASITTAVVGQQLSPRDKHMQDGWHANIMAVDVQQAHTDTPLTVCQT